MSGVHFTDGFDRPETIALGLDAPRLVTVVVGALSAYGVMQAPLPMALRAVVAVVIAVVAAVLGWGRYMGRPLLSWAWLALRFALAPRSGGGVPAVHVDAAPAAVEPVVAVERAPVPVAAAPVDPALPPWARWLEMDVETRGAPAEPVLPQNTVEMSRTAPMVVLMEQAAPALEPSAGEGDDDGTELVELPGTDTVDLPDAPDVGDADTAPSADDERGAVVHLPFGRAAHTPAREPHDPELGGAHGVVLTDAEPPPVFVGAPRRLTFFSLKGGAGRTTLATEVACILAARGRHRSHDGVVRPLQVALLDLDLSSATVAVRLGIAHPTLADYLARGGDPDQLDSCMVRHRSGVHVLLGPPKPVASGPAAVEPARVAEIVHRLERDGAHFVVIDVGADLGAVTTWVLSAVHDVFVVMAPTASGVQDAYRTTEALRRLGLGHKLRYVVNRARSTPDLAEVMGDLGGRIAAVIPEDHSVEDAENNHRIVALDGSSPAATALHDLAALVYPSLSASPSRARMAWRPWRRRVG